MQSRRWYLSRLGWSLAAAAVPITWSAPTLAEAKDTVRVLAASDLKFALTRIAQDYQKQTGQPIALTFGSSGNMARQLMQGLGADLFLSADESYVEQLARAGLTRSDPLAASATGQDGAGASPAGVLYALGRLALYVAPGVAIEADGQLLGLQRDWSQVVKFAIANPEHAPYGRAAREVLQTLGMWQMVQPRLVLGENIAQVNQFVATGAAQAGITALSLVQAPELHGQGRYVALPAHLHRPLRQRMVLLKAASAQAIAFYRHLQQPSVRAVLAQYGFAAPP